MPKWIVQILAPLLCGALLLLGVVALNSFLRAYFRDNQHCTIAFSDIECKPPGKLSREEFLGEVQYLANWPDDINLLDDGLAARLHLSFAVHPWVEAVERVRITPPRQVCVLLRYRAPVLAVAQAEEKTDAWILARDGKTKLSGRVVDHNGVLLPLAAADSQLPVLYGEVPPPTGRAGQPWGDAGVTTAAAVAAVLLPYQEQFNLKDFEIVSGVLILSNKHSSVHWGSLAEQETPQEGRLQALLDILSKRGSLKGWNIDVRRPDQPLVTPRPRP
jgi:hypothetical protein